MAPGGIAVLALSLAFWTPSVWGITRYLRRLTAAADDIAGGRFQITIPPRGNDELGNPGRTIESMAARLGHLVAGQKRFPGDAAHELCAPLARIRTGLGILEGLSIVTDPALLGRALGNLIRNAAIHAGPRARVSIVAVDGPDSVSVTVPDNGPGVPKNELPHIFEPFFRIDRSRSRDTGGSGLGLAIVRSAIESCGGEAVAFLPENGGFAVTLRLPQQTAESA